MTSPSEQPSSAAPTDPARGTPIASMTLRGFLEALAAKTPTPGGGAAAGTVGAIAAATGGMVVSYSLGRKDLAAHQPALESAATYLRNARAMFLQLADEDAVAYGLVNALQKLPADDPRRLAEWDAATRAAVAVPLAALAAAADVLDLLLSLRGKTNRWLESDLDVAQILARAAAQSAACNVRINLPTLDDPAARSAAQSQMDQILARSTAG